MAIANEIRRRLRRWLNRQETLREFEDWFVPATWGADSRSAGELVENIDMNLALYTQGEIDPAVLRTEFEKSADITTAHTPKTWPLSIRN